MKKFPPCAYFNILITDLSILYCRAVMEKCGDLDDCISTSKATELAASLDEKVINDLPLPGQVDFINGGPPCQVIPFPLLLNILNITLTIQKENNYLFFFRAFLE